MSFNRYGHHVQPPSLQQEIVNSLSHAVHRLLSEQSHIFLARFDKLDDEISKLRNELVELKETGKEQVNQVSQGLRRTSMIQAAANEGLKDKLEELEKAVCGEDSRIFLKLKTIDENVLELYEKAADPLAGLPEPPLRHDVATSPIKSGTPSTDDEDVVPAYKTPSFVTADWSITLADLHATSTPSANKRVFVPDLSVQGREQYSLLSNSSVASLKDCMHNSEPRVTYVHTAVSPITKTQTQSPPPLPDPVHVDPVPFEECLPESEPEQPEPEPDPSVLSPVLKSPTAYSPPSLPYFPPTLPLPKVQTKAHDAGSPLTSIASDSDDEEHVSKMVVPSSVTPPIFSPIFTPPIRLKRLSDSPSRTPQTASKKRKLDMVPMPKKKRKIVWPEISVDTSSATKWIACDSCNFWYHYGCVGIRSDKQPKRFKCPPCQSGQTSVNPHQSSEMECARKDCCHNNTDEFVISRIIGRSRDRRTIEGKYVWLVEWEGYDISAATWQEENTIGDPRSLIRQFYKALQVAGVQNDPETRVILPSVRNRLPEDLLALFP